MRIIPHTGDIIPINTSEGMQYGNVKYVSPRTQLPYAGVEVNGELRTHTFAELQDPQDALKHVKVIALTGESRVGKSRIAEELSRKYNETGLNAHVMSFADPLRDMAYDLDMEVDQKPNGDPLGWQQAYEEAVDLVERDLGGELVSGPEFDRRVHDYMKVYHDDYRDVLYRIANAVKKQQPDFFAALLYDELRDMAGYGVKRFIIDDLRFTVEYELLEATVQDFAVHYLLTDSQAEKPDTYEAKRRRGWAQETGGLVHVIRGHAPQDVKADAHDIYDHHEAEPDQTEPDQDEKKTMKVKPGTMFIPHEGVSLDDDEGWSAMGEVIDGVSVGPVDTGSIDPEEFAKEIENQQSRITAIPNEPVTTSTPNTTAAANEICERLDNLYNPSKQPGMEELIHIDSAKLIVRDVLGY